MKLDLLKKKPLLFCMLAFLLLFVTPSVAQFVALPPLTASGNFVVPAGVTRITIECWGGGGGGGGASSNNSAGGGGGGGGYTRLVNYAVTPGAIIPFIVGIGGTAGATGNGGNGGNTSFNGLPATLATGGAGGIEGTSGPGADGAGGAAGTGSLFNGGNGGTGSGNGGAVGGGGGGGAAGSGGNGNDGVVITRGNGGIVFGTGGTAGGNGGNGGGSNANGTVGSVIGGGGGGGHRNSNNRNGGAGARGQIIITYIGCGTLLVGTAVANPFKTIQSSLDVLTVYGINCPITLELQDGGYTLSSEASFNKIPGQSATNTVTIRPRALLNATITRNAAGKVMNFSNECEYYIINGLSTAGNGSLTITNDNTGFTSTGTIIFQNGASNNIITNCTILGSSTYSSTTYLSTIYFGAASATNGNSNNTISNNTITSAGSNLPTIAIASVGTNTAGLMNSDNIISGNNISNFFSASNNSYGIIMIEGTTDWLINGNSFYQTSNTGRSITSPSIDYNPVWLNTTSGVNTRITNNFVGGLLPGALGGMSVIGGRGAFKGLKVNGGFGVKNVISGNVIRNIDFTTDHWDVCTLINHADGNIDIINNTIGSQTSLSSIILRSSFTRTLVGTIPNQQIRSGSYSLISVGGAIGEPVLTSVVSTAIVTGNIVGGVTALRVGANGDVDLRGIDFENNFCNFTISNNTIGGTIANSISNNSNNPISGIVGITGRVGFTHLITNNTVRNLTSTLTGAGSTNNTLTGISANAGGTYNIATNDVFTLSSSYSVSNTYGLVGIQCAASGSNQSISDNFIRDIVQNAAGGSPVSGMVVFNTVGGDNTVARNRIYAITSSNAANTTVEGISNYWSGNSNTVNNMIVLGYDILGISSPTVSRYSGILENTSSGRTNIVYNSVHIGGAGTGTAAPICTGILSSGTDTRIIANNLLVIDRVTTNAMSLPLWIQNIGATTDQNNNMYSTGTPSSFVGAIGGTAYGTLAGYISVSPTALYSVTVPCQFLDGRTDLRLTPSPDEINFPVANEGIPLPAIATTDFYGATRNAYTPDPGFQEFTCRGCWVGKNSTVWQVSGLGGAGGNWEDGFIPNTVTNTKVYDAPNQPTINQTSGARPVLDLWLKTPGIVTLTNPSAVGTGKLQVYGSFEYNRGGWIDGRFGTLEMYGNATQVLRPNLLVANTLQDLIISNNSTTFGFALQAFVDITRSLTYTAAGQKLSTFGYLTMKSTNAFTAYIGNLTGKAIDGTAVLERYLPSRAAWRFVSAPVQVLSSPSVRASWQENGTATSGLGTQITGPTFPATGNFDQYTQRYSMKYFNPATGDFTDVTNTSNSLANTAGYMLFVRGDRNVAVGGTTSATTLRVRGNVRKDNQTFDVLTNRFASIGNPYVSQVDLRTVNFDTVARTYYRWNPSLPGLYGVGGYETFTLSTGNFRQIPGGAIENNIENGQAFYVRNNNADSAGRLTFKEADKSIGSITFSRGGETKAEDGKTLSLNLYSTIGGNEMLADGWRLRFRDDYNNGFDNDDAEKIFNTYNNIGIKSNNKTLVVDSRKTIVDRDTIFMNMTSTPAASYRFTLVPEEFYQPGLQAFLVDKFTNTTKAVSLADSTWYAFSVTADAGSRAADRFYITFKQQIEAPLKYISLDAKRNNDGSNAVAWNVDNEEQMVSYSVERAENGIEFAQINKQNARNDISKKANYSFTDLKPSTTVDIFYRIKGTGISGKTYYSDQVKITPLVGKTSIAITPNPVTNGIVQLKMEHLLPGDYTIKIVNKLGQNVMQKTVKLQDWRQFISFPVNLPQGIYVITVANSKAVIHTENLSISR